MKVFKLPIPENERLCDNCEEMPARIRLLVGGNASEVLCSACVGVICMEIEAIFLELDQTLN